MYRWSESTWRSRVSRESERREDVFESRNANTISSMSEWKKTVHMLLSFRHHFPAERSRHRPWKQNGELPCRIHFFFAPDQQPDLIHQYYMTHQRAVLLSLCTRWERRCLNDCKQCERMGQYLNETHSLAERRPARPPHITHEQHVWFFQASNGMSRMNRAFAVYSRYPGIHAHIHQLNHRFMGTLAGVFLFVGFGCYACKEYHSILPCVERPMTDAASDQ